MESAVQTSGSYKLQNDIALTSVLTVPEDVTVNLDLGGHKLEASGSVQVPGKLPYEDFSTYGLIVVEGTLTLTSGTLNAENTNELRGVYVGSSGNFTLGMGATIQGGKLTEHNHGGGGVKNTGTFTLAGGTIKDSSADIGGGVSNSGTFTMLEGTIENCNAQFSGTGNGGGVYNEGTFEMRGASLKTARLRKEPAAVCTMPKTLPCREASLKPAMRLMAAVYSII